MIGRVKEYNRLMEAYESKDSEFVAVYGRRRVGKTYLVRETFDGQFTFQHSGLAKGGMKRQLTNFAVSLKVPFKGLKDLGPLEALLSGPSKKELERKKKEKEREEGWNHP